MNLIEGITHILITVGMPVFRAVNTAVNRPYATDPGDFGRGIYWTTSEARAKSYGKTIERRVLVLANPKVLMVSEAYDLATEYGTVGPNLSTEVRLKNSQRLTNDLVSQGYDSLVSINESMNEIEIVIFRSNI